MRPALAALAALALTACATATVYEPPRLLFEEDRAVFRAEQAYLERVNATIRRQHGDLPCREYVAMADAVIYGQWRKCPLGYYASSGEPGHEVLMLISPHGFTWIVDNGADGGVVPFVQWSRLGHRAFNTRDGNDCLSNLSFEQHERLGALFREFDDAL